MFDSLRNFDPTAVLKHCTLDEFLAAMDAVNTNPKSITSKQRFILEMARPKTVRSCGSCNACCHFPAIEEKDIDGEVLTEPKPACQTCKFSTDTGCSRYSERPEICKGYACTYIIGDTPHRPDVVRCAWTYSVMEDEGKPRSIMVGHTDNVQSAIDDERNRAVISEALQSGLFAVVVVRSSEEAIAYNSDGWVDYVMVDPSDPLKVRLNPATEKYHVERWKP